MNGRKSTIKEKWMGCNPKSHLEVDKWQEREDNSLDPCLTNQWGGGEQTERGEREEEESFRERSSHFSLDFPAIGSSNLGKARGKVDSHCKGYVWVQGLWSFDNSRR